MTYLYQSVAPWR